MQINKEDKLRNVPNVYSAQLHLSPFIYTKKNKTIPFIYFPYDNLLHQKKIFFLIVICQKFSFSKLFPGSYPSSVHVSLILSDKVDLLIFFIIFFFYMYKCILSFDL